MACPTENGNLWLVQLKQRLAAACPEMPILSFTRRQPLDGRFRSWYGLDVPLDYGASYQLAICCSTPIWGVRHVAAGFDGSEPISLDAAFEESINVSVIGKDGLLDSGTFYFMQAGDVVYQHEEGGPLGGVLAKYGKESSGRYTARQVIDDLVLYAIRRQSN